MNSNEKSPLRSVSTSKIPEPNGCKEKRKKGKTKEEKEKSRTPF
jgi:hypothetical protein